jgi:hypothetical protein
VFDPAGQRRLDEYCSMSVPASDELVFRVADATERDLLKMNPGRPARAALYEHRPPSMREVDEGEARRLVINGENLLVEGIAGVGKTHFVQSLVLELRALGKSVAILSKTHVASQRAGGCTADHWVRRHVLHGSPSAQVVWVDEAFQIDTSLLAQFNKIATRQWLLSGDPHQFPPVFDGWRGAPVAESAFRDSNLLKTLSGGHRLTLTTCHRSDTELFAWYSSLIQGGARFELSLATVLAEARARASASQGLRATTSAYPTVGACS